MRTGNNVGGNEFAQLPDGLRAGVNRGRNGGNGTFHNHSDTSAEPIFPLPTSVTLADFKIARGLGVAALTEQAD